MFSNADVARCRSAAYAVLAMAFTTPETDTGHQASVRAAALLPDLLEACGAKKLRRLARRLAHTWPSADTHRRLFETTPAREKPPHGTDSAAPAHADADSSLVPFLSVIENETSRSERGDHVAVECEMMSALAGEEAQALDRQDEIMASLAREAESALLRHRLSRFAPAFGERIGRVDPDGFYGGMGRVLSAFVQWDCTQHGVEVPPSIYGAIR
jgi:TorA maturation chaperone TorD